jgi:FkbM family methyltransferase
MNPIRLMRNAATSWSHSVGYGDAVKRLLLAYSARLPPILWRRDWTISFRYPPPIGTIRLVLRANGSDSFVHSEIFEHEYYSLPVERPPATVLDLGANIGLSTIYFARMFPGARLACVEPIPENLQVLACNLNLNGIEAEVISAAIDVCDGKVWMESINGYYGHKIVAERGHSFTGQFEVSAVSIPSILRRLGWSRIGLLKMDIEGHEWRLLSENCDWLHVVDTMCFEWHDQPGESELTRLANQFGFLAPQRLPVRIWLMTR